jgi:hypothetical protein
VSVTAYAREEESKKGADGSQITGASSSYARKYALNGLFLIDDTKDSDATNEHDKAPAKPYTPPTAPAAPKPELVSSKLLTELRSALIAAGLTGDNATGFCVTVIGKDKPTNNAEAERILYALENK